MLDRNIIYIVTNHTYFIYLDCSGAIGPAEMRQAVAHKLCDVGISPPALWA